ncbi:MAG: PEP-CTERM sorting domain-containing protein [Gammaproteobacteria bacterium]|nr:PEP-CTERM sorting domain-containing protein [Gammaproteobacteria bacterium]
MNKFTKLVAAVALSAFAGIASAVPITGDILFTGTINTDTDDVTTATVFTFDNPINVAFADFSFAPLIGQDITYSTLDLGAALPLSPLWTGVGSDMVSYSFDLLAIASSVDTDTRTLSGIGLVTIGSDTKDYSWRLTTQNPGAGSTPLTFSFSATQAAVPEPAITLLLATGLVGLGFARRTRKTV